VKEADGVGDGVLDQHALAQHDLDLGHALLGALEAHGPSQLLGLAPGEAGHGHGHAQQLLLEQGHPEGPG